MTGVISTQLTRRQFLARTSSAAGITFLGGCCPSPISLNFLITAEDSSGAVLGSGVWRWSEYASYKQFCWEAGWEGEAIQIKLPSGKLAFILKSLSSDLRSFGGFDIFDAYRKAGSVKDVQQPGSSGHGGMGSSRMEAIRRSKARIALPPDIVPRALVFSDLRNPRTADVVEIRQSVRLSNAIDARLWIEPTDRNITTGIEKQLPWLAKLKPKEAIPGFEGKFWRWQFKSSWKEF